MFANGWQGGPSGGSGATEARPSLPSLNSLGPFLRADIPQGAAWKFLLVAVAGDWLSKNLPAPWRGGRCRAWPGPAAGGGSDRFRNWVFWHRWAAGSPAAAIPARPERKLGFWPAFQK